MAKECSNSSCNKSSCEGCGQKQPQSLMAEPNVFSDVKHVIGVLSGKGGVGKSFVTGSLANMVKQFWSDVIWGELDYLFVDMPPGTGDVPLTVFQSLPIDGVVIVTSPQDLVRMIVKKAYNMADMMKVPVLGIVENYSYVKCPDCGKEIKVFGESHIDEIAAELKVPVLGKMPIDVKLAELADSGLFSKIENEYITAAADVMPKDEA